MVEKNDKIDSDEFMLTALDFGATDVIEYDDSFEVICKANEHNKLSENLTGAGYNVLSAETSMVPDSYIDLDDEKIIKFNRMIDALEDLDDVQEVYHNVNLPEETD